MNGEAIGVDLGGTNLRVARITTDGGLMDRATESIGRDPDTVVRRVVELCRDRIGSNIQAVGLGIPGRVETRQRVVLSGGYLDLAKARVANRIEDALGKPVIIDNDCNMALVAEMALGAARAASHVVMFTIGTGIGGAVALDGRIVRGAGTAGQLGHLTVRDEGLPCVCGRRGCVETTSSGTALGRLIAEAGWPAGTRVDALLDATDEGDLAAARLIDTWIHPLRAAIDSMVAAIHPDLVLLGGGLGIAATRALARAPALAPWYQCPVAAAALGDSAGLIGAGLTAMKASHQPAALAAPKRGAR